MRVRRQPARPRRSTFSAASAKISSHSSAPRRCAASTSSAARARNGPSPMPTMVYVAHVRRCHPRIVRVAAASGHGKIAEAAGQIRKARHRPPPAAADSVPQDHHLRRARSAVDKMPVKNCSACEASAASGGTGDDHRAAYMTHQHARMSRAGRLSLWANAAAHGAAILLIAGWATCSASPRTGGASRPSHTLASCSRSAWANQRADRQSIVR